jgi:outer membrane lipoprotein
MIMKTAAILMLSTILLSACVSGPKPLRGEFSNITPTQAAKDNTVNAKVRWGGRIVAVNNQAQRSCFEIVGLDLYSSARPQAQDRSIGRFIACRSGFYDPDVFKAGREVTITGAIDAFESRKIGEYDYRYPMVSADVIYLWPEQRDVDVIIERPYFFW